jgi:hypothetical protein
MEPRNRATPGCRRAPNTRQATAGTPLRQGVLRTWRGRSPLAGPETWGAGPGRPCPWSGLSPLGPHGEPRRGTAVMPGGRASDRSRGPTQRQHNIQGGQCWRRTWREGSGPRGTWRSKPGAGHSAGVSCHMRSAAYGRHLRVPARRPEARARCGSAARRDLGGGRRVTGVPTATLLIP